jgi:hypothetical protein
LVFNRATVKKRAAKQGMSSALYVLADRSPENVAKLLIPRSGQQRFPVLWIAAGRVKGADG